MSRIHEALKRAEEERALVGSEGLRELAPLPVPDFAVLGSGTPRATAVVELGGGIEVMLERTAVAEWKPDLATMLFANGNDGARGTEEYRTLRSRLRAAFLPRSRSLFRSSPLFAPSRKSAI